MKTIAIDKICKTPLQQALGLMFSKKKTLLFELNKEKHLAIHNFFVFYPTSLIFLDKNKKVIEIKTNFRPFALYKSKTKAKYLIETPLKTFKTKLKLEEKVELKLNYKKITKV